METLNLAVLIPIWRESQSILKQNIRVFSNLKYPPKTKVFWLLHETDDETPRKAGYIPFEVLLDNGDPPLKAKALNNATEKINAKVFAVFDVDAIPEENFLVDAYEDLLHVHKEDPKVVCLQGARYCYHPRENWLAKRNRKEYEWLRSTSVRCYGNGFLIFRETLQKVGGWPLTVAEDSALSKELLKRDYIIHRFYGKYFEEAPNKLRDWAGQRVRWRKNDSCWENLEHAIRLISFNIKCFAFLIFIFHPTWDTLRFWAIVNIFDLVRDQLTHLKKVGVKDYLTQQFINFVTIYTCLRAEIEKSIAKLRWFHTPKYGKAEKKNEPS